MIDVRCAQGGARLPTPLRPTHVPRWGHHLVEASVLVALLFPFAARVSLAAVPRVKVEVLGIQGELRRNVVATLSIGKKQERRRATEAYLRHLHTRAESEIRLALQPFGYYRPLVRSELLTQGKWIARYTVDPGPPLLLDTVRVEVTGEGASDPEFQKRVAAFPLHRGDVLRQPSYEAGKAAFEAYAAEGGYVDGVYASNRMIVDLERYAAAIDLRFDSGPRHRFGDVFFDQEVIDPKMLSKFATFKIGDPLDFRKMLQLQTDLSNTGYYSRVEVTPQLEADDENEQVPILVTLTPSRLTRMSGGVGYGTDDGGRVRSVTELRRLNRFGHRAQIDLQFAQIDKSGGAKYMIPIPNPRTDLVTLSGGYRDERTTVSTSAIWQGGVDFTRRLGLWQVTGGSSFRQETFTVGSDAGTVRFLMPEISWERTRADNRFDVKNGDRLRLELRGAQGSFFSNASLLQAHLTGKGIFGLGTARAIFRVEGGYTNTNDFHRLPPSIRFFAGGASSVRGYAFNSLGPRDSLGRVLGGRHLMVGSVELDHRILPQWGAAVFYDMGNALDKIGDKLMRGVGVGVRWWSPVGLVRADVGWGLDRPGHAVELHLLMGPEL